MALRFGESTRDVRGLMAVMLFSTIWLVSAEEAQEPASPVDSHEFGTIVSTANVNLRSCAHVECDIVKSVSLGDEVAITGPHESGFIPVIHDGESGWIWYLYVSTPASGTPELRNGDKGCNRVAFIFNVGIGYEFRMPVLEYLRDESVPVTIFPMGWWAEENSETLKQVHEMGFDIGSHGNVRQLLTEQTDEAVSEDVTNSFAKIRQVIGEDPKPYFTPYAAEIDERVRKLVGAQGYVPVGWGVPAADYGEGITEVVVLDRVVPNVYDGAIVEFHLDGPATAESTEVAMPAIVDALRDQGYMFVTISDMAKPCVA